MKISFVGKGGSGKTTLAALSARAPRRDRSGRRRPAATAGHRRGRVHVVGNKVDDASDVESLRQHVGADLLTWLTRSRYVKGAERGTPEPVHALEPADRTALELLRSTVDAQPKDWATYRRHAVEFHLRNALAWANDRVGEDLAGQVDPDFVFGPEMPVR